MLRLHNVLCVVRYFYRHRNGTKTVNAVVGVKVIKPEAFIIENIFERRMLELLRAWSEDFIGERPDAYQLVGFHVQRVGGFVRVNTFTARLYNYADEQAANDPW